MRLIILSVVFALSLGACASNETWARLPLLSLVASLDHAERNSIDTMPTDEVTHRKFSEMLQNAVTGNQDAAAQAAQHAGYVIFHVTENGRHYTVMSNAEESVGPTVVLAASPQRDLVFEAPHGVSDRATDIQSAIAMTRLGARALILAGAHRCAASAESICSGQTRICGAGTGMPYGLAPYRVSDVAHNEGNRFNAAHLALTKVWPASVVVQLHGFSVKDTDSWVVLSDGSRERRPNDAALVGKVRNGIREWFGKRKRAVSCQDPNDDDIYYRKLCARTNVQGRHLNGSPGPCETTSGTATGRFLHIEQGWDIRREARDHWDEIEDYPLATVAIDAIGKALPCTLVACR